VSSSNGLFIFLGVLFAILVMLFVIKTKRQKEQKELIDSISTDKEKLYSEEHSVEASPAINADTIKDINLSDTTLNLSDTDQKPTNSD
jgi:predicted membrane protein